MARVPELLIRPAEFVDLDAMYSICLRTGAAGGDATGQYRDGDLLGHIYVGPYVLLESAFGLVLDAGGDVVGYALGAPDTAAFDVEAAEAWWPRLRTRYPLPDGAEPYDGTDAGLIALMHRPPTTPTELLAAYPAHLHIDLLPEAQGTGAGRRLIEALEDGLRERGATGVHLGVDPANVAAQGFYAHVGYRRLAPGELGTPPGVYYVKALS